MRQPADSVLPPAWSKLLREVLMLAVLDFVPWPVPCLARLATVSVRYQTAFDTPRAFVLRGYFTDRASPKSV